MKYILLPLIALLFLLPHAEGAGKKLPHGWVLVFEDNFNEGKLDTRKWSRIPYVPYQGADWRKYQSMNKKLVAHTAGSIKFLGTFGKYKTQICQDKVQPTYACGGIQSMGKFSFQYGRVEVRARFDCVQGCWPAIWMMPDVSPGGWPNGGEIDIMEHINHENIVYQTLHLPNGNGKHMQRGVRPALNKPVKNNKVGWHVYGVDWTPEAITFYLDGKPTGTIRSDISPKWPFSKDNNTFYLILDQQIGGRWVEGSGNKGIDQKQLKKKPAVLEIDYVRVYSDPKYMFRTESEENTDNKAALKKKNSSAPGKRRTKKAL